MEFLVCRTKTRQTLRFPRLDKIKIVVTQVLDPGNFPCGGSYSEGCFIGDINGVGSDFVLYAQLKSSEMGNFGCFLLEIADFSTVSAKLGNPE